MIKTETPNKIERIGGGESHQFSIKVSRAAFSILSGLYSDTPLAIIRELSTNAMDSHVAAGKPLQPIQVHLPNSLEPNLIIKDEGLGLSHEDVIQIYSTYFESTKTQSNDFNGCLGLGSKAPFAYTDNFTITSIHNGVKRHYLAFFDEGGAPTITLGSENSTDEENGVEIRIPVQSKDFNRFVDSAKKVYQWFSVRPVVTGANISFDETPKLIEGSDWYILEGGQSYSNRSYAVMGGVAYPINSDQVTHSGNNNYCYELLRNKLVINFKIGDIDFVPSREALDYNERTVKALRDKIEVIKNEIVKHAKDILANAQYVNDVVKLHKGLPNFVRSIIGNDIKFKGNSIKDIRPLPNRYLSLRSWGKNKVKSTNYDYFSVSHMHLPVYVLSKQNTLWKVKKMMEDKNLTNCIVIDSDYQKVLTDQYSFDPAIFHSVDVELAHYTKTASVQSGRTYNNDVVGIFEETSYNRKEHFTNCDLTAMIQSGAKYYVIKNGTSAIWLFNESISKTSFASKYNGKLNEVVAVAPTKEKNAINAGLIKLESVFKKELAAMSKDAQLIRYTSLREALKNADYSDLQFGSFVKFAKEAKNFSSDLAKVITLIGEYNNLKENTDVVNKYICFNSFSKRSGVNINIQPIDVPNLSFVDSLVIASINVIDKYWGYNDKIDFKKVISVDKYIEFEKAKEKGLAQ